MTLRHAFLAAALMAISLPAAAQPRVVATGKIDKIIVGEKESGTSIHLILTDNGGQKWELFHNYNLNDAPGPPLLGLLLSARNTGARVSLLCATTCDPLVFDSILLD